MSVTKLEDRLVASDITPEWLAESMKALNIEKIPKHQRANAMREHMLRVMAHSVVDPQIKKSLQDTVESMRVRKQLML